MTTIAVLVGSLRRGSINLALARALERMARGRLDFDYLDVAALPMFNEDLEDAPPEPVIRFRAGIAVADGVLIVSPEYNRSMPAVVKNAVDWGSRPFSANGWADTPCGLIGISPSRTGTAVAQSQLRAILVNLGAALLTRPEVYLVHAPGFFDSAGDIADAETARFLSGYLDGFTEWVERYRR